MTGRPEDDAILVAELSMAVYAALVDDALAIEWARVRESGGAWGDEAAYLGELCAMAATFRAVPPAKWARDLLDDA